MGNEDQLSAWRFLGALCLAASVCGAAAGGSAGVLLGLTSEFQAATDPQSAQWGAAGSGLKSSFVYAVIGAFLGIAAGLVSFSGAASVLLLSGKARSAGSTRSVGGSAGLGAGISTAVAACLLLPRLGTNTGVFLIGVGFVLFSSVLAGVLAARVARSVTGDQTSEAGL